MNNENIERKLKREAAIEAAKVTAGISTALASSEGRALLWWVLELSGTFHQSFSSNALITAFNSGKREVGLLVLDKLAQTDSLAFIRMQAERTQNDNRTNPPDAGNDTISRESDFRDSED